MAGRQKVSEQIEAINLLELEMKAREFLPQRRTTIMQAVPTPLANCCPVYKQLRVPLPADFAPLAGAWCCFRLRLRLKDG